MPLLRDEAIDAIRHNPMRQNCKKITTIFSQRLLIHGFEVQVGPHHVAEDHKRCEFELVLVEGLVNLHGPHCGESHSEQTSPGCQAQLGPPHERPDHRRKRQRAEEVHALVEQEINDAKRVAPSAQCTQRRSRVRREVSQARQVFDVSNFWHAFWPNGRGPDSGATWTPVRSDHTQPRIVQHHSHNDGQLGREEAWLVQLGVLLGASDDEVEDGPRKHNPLDHRKARGERPERQLKRPAGPNRAHLGHHPQHVKASQRNLGAEQERHNPAHPTGAEARYQFDHIGSFVDCEHGVVDQRLAQNQQAVAGVPQREAKHALGASRVVPMAAEELA
mmetsp:Transcript_22840/g.65919  ORF Transcript_22840/g.65919 Transcript_22840/m.65919 type:complete len:332 (+) Transcript_22840:722-1717(+)